jgi:RNA polymerase sigma-70 factor (ECF subfamily)
VTDVPGDRADDVQLWKRLLAGDDDALAEAYDQWSTLIHSLAMRITADHAAAEDVTQDVFVHLWQHPDRYDPHRGALRSWLCLLARSRALDWLRRCRTQDRYHAAAAAIAPMPAEVDDGVVWQAEAKAVREAVAALPDRQREAVLLAYYRGRTYREVARDLEIPEGTAKGRLKAALSGLADSLAAEGILER